MLGMHNDRTINTLIFIGSTLTFGLSLRLACSQTTIKDVSWMQAIIPHHQIAILTSERANITDTRVRKLADGIIAGQRKEIGEMKALIKYLNANAK
ncbi:MAG: hypothetical protein ACI8WM_003221 [Burkholderiaceae bacterium]|jgi:uncharacterized protein (DUF305 family)